MLIRRAVAATAGIGLPRRFAACHAGLLLLLGAVLGGCAINPQIRLAELEAGPVQLAGVPFFAQDAYQCGPAALAGVLGASGISTDAAALVPQVYLPGREGSLQVELLAATRRAGRIPYLLDRQPEALIAELVAGRPVLVMQNLGTPRFARWHYAVVTGIDPESNQFVLNSGVDEALTMRARSFLRSWNWAHRWGFVVLAPGELPASADPMRYAEAAADFEGVAGPQAGRLAWNAALQRWPEDHRPRLALGNLAHAEGELRVAVAHYHDGLLRVPGQPVLSNNLASVLGELGCNESARAVLAPALEQLSADSPWRPALQRTAAGLYRAEAVDAVDAVDAVGCDVLGQVSPARQ